MSCVDYHLSTQLYKEFYLHVFMIAKYQNLLGHQVKPCWKSGKVLSKRDVMLMSEKIEFVLNAANDVVHLITHMISHREWIQTCGLIWKQM